MERSPPVDADDAQLVVLVGHASGRRYVVGTEIELGRGSGSPIELLDDGVSRRHARVRRTASGYTIEDLGSRNGTFVNGERVAEAELNFGDKIAVGSRTVLLFANRDRFEDQRIQAQKLQALGQLSGGIAHDFNNLLGVILGNATHLQSLQKSESSLPEETLHAALADIETAARRAVDLTRQLLAFARSGQRRHAAVNLSSVVADAERLLRRTLHRSIELKASVADNLTVVGDPSQLLQVLMNLCINAGDAMPSGGVLRIEVLRASFPQVDASGTNLLSNGDVAVLRVCDEGVGMDASVRARAFEPFFTTKPRGKGTGLGLATVHAIVRDHGGDIRVDSEVGQGTTFEVLLPCGASEPNVDPRNTTRTAVQLSGVVLLADDETLVRTAARRMLEHAGLDVIEAGDGEQAVDVFSSNADRVDLVILDLDMPHMDGEQAARRLHALAPELPILISSGYIDADREQSLRTAGVNGVLHKPYDSRALLKAVRAACSSD